MSYTLGGLGGSCSAAVLNVGGLIVKFSLFPFNNGVDINLVHLVGSIINLNKV